MFNHLYIYNSLIIRINIKNNIYKRYLIDIKFYFEVEKEKQGINLLVWYFLFFVLTQFMQILRSILYKRSKSLVFSGPSKFVDWIDLDEENWLKFNFLLGEAGCLSSFKILFRVSSVLFIFESFELK